MSEVDIQRRLILKGMGALGAGTILVACGGGSSNNSSSSSSSAGGIVVDPTNNSKGSSAATCTNTASIPLIIDASTAATGDLAGVPVYAYIIGMVKIPQQVFYWYDFAQNKPVLMMTGDNQIAAGSTAYGLSGSNATANYPNIWANYASSRLETGCATVVADLASFNANNIKDLGTGDSAFSGRIYISVGTPLLPFTPRDSSNNAQPATSTQAAQYTAPALTSGTPGALCLYDWLEFSYDVNGALNINTTQVDQYGFSISMTATGTDVTGGEQGIYNKSRSTILSTLQGLSTPNGLYNATVSVPTSNVAAGTYPSSTMTSGYLRAVSPKSIVGENSGTLNDPFSYFSSTISTWYSNWTSQPLVVTDSATGTYSGMVSGGVLTFKQGSYATQSAWSSASSTGSFTNSQITSYDVWLCANSLASGSAAQKNVQKQIGAAFQRGTMGYTLNDTSGSFQPDLSGNYKTSPYNIWSKNFHQFSSNGLAYGFPYDDVGSLQPTITTTSTTGLRIQLGKFE